MLVEVALTEEVEVVVAVYVVDNVVVVIEVVEMVVVVDTVVVEVTVVLGVPVDVVVLVVVVVLGMDVDDVDEDEVEELWPGAENSRTLLLPESATHRLPEESNATLSGAWSPLTVVAAAHELRSGCPMTADADSPETNGGEYRSILLLFSSATQRLPLESNVKHKGLERPAAQSNGERRRLHGRETSCFQRNSSVSPLSSESTFS